MNANKVSSRRGTKVMAVAAVLLTLGLGGIAAARPGAANGTAYFNAGHKLLEQGDTRLGLQYVATAVALNPNDFGAQTYLQSLLDQDRFRDDAVVLESIRPLLPTYPPLMERLAKVYEGQQRQGEAGKIYEAWQAERPESAEPQARAGEHYRFTGENAKAVQAFSQYLDVVQESDYALRRIAESAAKIATAQAALTAIHVALEH
jgi:tetratricopeptide (TPR) repeat protein